MTDSDYTLQRIYHDNVTGYDVCFQIYPTNAGNPASFIDRPIITPNIPLLNANYKVDLPEGVIHQWHYKGMEFDKGNKYLGLSAAQVLTIDINLNVLKGDGSYLWGDVHFQNLLLNPYNFTSFLWKPPYFGDLIHSNDWTIYFAQTCYMSLCIDLWFDIHDGNRFQKVWAGAIPTSKRNKPDFIKGIYQVEFWDMGSIIAQQLDSHIMMLFKCCDNGTGTMSLHNSLEYYEYIYSYPIADKHYASIVLPPEYNSWGKLINSGYVDNRWKKSWIWNIYFQDFRKILQDYFSKLLGAFFRDSYLTFYLDLPLATYYKQTYGQPTGVRGTAITGDLLIPAFFTNKPYEKRYITNPPVYMWDTIDLQQLGGAFMDIPNNHKFICDFLADYYKQELVRAGFAIVGGVMGFYTDKILNSTNITVGINQENMANQLLLDSFDYIDQTEVLKRAQASSVEKVGEDIDMIENVGLGGRQDDNINIGVMFGNVPAAQTSFWADCNWYMNHLNSNIWEGMHLEDTSFLMLVGHNWYVKGAWDGHRLVLLYEESMINDTGGNPMVHNPYSTPEGFAIKYLVRVHEWCKYDLGNSHSSDDKITFNNIDNSWLGNNHTWDGQDKGLGTDANKAVQDTVCPPPGKPQAQLLQQFSGKMVIISKTLLALFNNWYNSTLKSDIRFISNPLGWFNILNWHLQWNPAEYVGMNSNIDTAIVSAYPQNYYLTKVELTGTDDSAEKEMIVSFDSFGGFDVT